MDWIVFGDDWGAHPSTTQHLILNLPPEDRILWFDSIGMRSPSLSLSDMGRIIKKGKSILAPKSLPTENTQLYKGNFGHFQRVQPKVLPFHMNKQAISFNGNTLRKLVEDYLREHQAEEPPILLSSTPVAAQYLNHIPHSKSVYLRLDVYEDYPGCDPELVKYTENKMWEKADIIAVTAKALYPGNSADHRTIYLPQGVTGSNFSNVPNTPPGNKILGFFGMLSEWLDYDLIREVARIAPDWTLEFIGKIEDAPSDLKDIPNIKLLPPVPFNELAQAITQWSAAWIPFKVNRLTLAVNPLKLTEYLAAGISTHCSPLPEAERFGHIVEITDNAERVKAWMEESLATDNEQLREQRKRAMDNESWAHRSKQLRDHVLSQMTPVASQPYASQG